MPSVLGLLEAREKKVREEVAQQCGVAVLHARRTYHDGQDEAEA
jgi:hypothetical protein